MTLKDKKESNLDNETKNSINNSIEVIRKCSKDILIDISLDTNLDNLKDNESNNSLPFVSLMTDVSRSNPDPEKKPLKSSDSPSRQSTGSEASFKSINSYSSCKIRKRGLKSDTSLVRNALQRSRIKTSETPRKDKGVCRGNPTKLWLLLGICTWIGRKGYQYLTGLYSDVFRESASRKRNCGNFMVEEVKQQKLLEELNAKQSRLEQENEDLREKVKKMTIKIHELEIKFSRQDSEVASVKGPPSSPPHPLPPPPLQPVSKLQRSKTLPRWGSSGTRVTAPRFTTTPDDLAKVKLRKAKDNPVRTKPAPKESQPLIKPDMLQSTRAKLVRSRPVATSTPKRQLTKLKSRQDSEVASVKGPPSSPPHPLPPPPLQPVSKLQRSNALPRCGSSGTRVTAPKLTITPDDLAKDKLRKAKDNPVRTKPAPKESQPLIKPDMLQSTRAKLVRSRPVATSTPKRQLTKLKRNRVLEACFR